MAKITSKLQVTIPKAVAQRHGLRPGMEVDFESAGDVVRIRMRNEKPADEEGLAWRLDSFDRTTERQRTRSERWRAQHPDEMEPTGRGWTREELYDRGLAR